MHSRIRSTALPVLALGVSAGLMLPSTPALAVSRPAAAVASASAVAPSSAAMSAASKPKAKPRVAPPKKIVFHEFEWGKVTTRWTKVKGVKWYQFRAYKLDPKSKFIYPFNIVPGSNYKINTKKLRYTFVDNFAPQKDAKRLQALPWRIFVASFSPNKSHRNSVAKPVTFRIKDKIVYKTIVIKAHPTKKQVKKYKSVVKKCVSVGAGAAVSTAVGGAGLAAVATFVPGVNALSWGAVAALTVVAGVGGTLGCFVTEKINPSSRHLRVVSA